MGFSSYLPAKWYQAVQTSVDPDPARYIVQRTNSLTWQVMAERDGKQSVCAVLYRNATDGKQNEQYKGDAILLKEAIEECLSGQNKKTSHHDQERGLTVSYAEGAHSNQPDIMLADPDGMGKQIGFIRFGDDLIEKMDEITRLFCSKLEIKLNEQIWKPPVAKSKSSGTGQKQLRP